MEKIKAIDIRLVNEGAVVESAVACYWLPKDMKSFLEKCADKYNIIGFEWDGSFNFGVILSERNE